MDLQLTDQVIFVAGSSRGIGRAIASALLAEGARVIITGRDIAALRRTEDELKAGAPEQRLFSFHGDLSDPSAIAVAFQQALERFGKIDHLIANLGGGSGTPGWQLPESEWHRLFEMNFFASVRLTEAAIPHLLSNQNGGSILYISSIVALEASPAPLPYSAAKAALNNYANNLARQLGPQRIRVNAIAPGNIFFAGGSWERHLNTRPDAVELMLRTDVPQQRFGSPEEIASLAVYLCSRQAGFASGACFVMDGGQTRCI